MYISMSELQKGRLSVIWVFQIPWKQCLLLLTLAVISLNSISQYLYPYRPVVCTEVSETYRREIRVKQISSNAFNLSSETTQPAGDRMQAARSDSKPIPIKIEVINERKLII
jgi:hypothetical protein